MRVFLFCMAILSAFPAFADDLSPLLSKEKIVLKGDWGRLECTPLAAPIILSGNQFKIVGGIKNPAIGKPNSTGRRVPLNVQQFRRICAFEVFDATGSKVQPEDRQSNYKINGAVKRITLKSSNPKSVSIVSAENCTIDRDGKAKITINFNGESGSFTVDVIRSKVQQGMSFAQVIKATGKPSLRYQQQTANNAVEVWRWEKSPWLSVGFKSFNGDPNEVFDVWSEALPTDDEIDQIKDEGRLLEDSRNAKKDKAN